MGVLLLICLLAQPPVSSGPQDCISQLEQIRTRYNLPEARQFAAQLEAEAAPGLAQCRAGAWLLVAWLRPSENRPAMVSMK